MQDKLDETYNVSLPKPRTESMADCRARAEEQVRLEVQESIKATGWPICKKCRASLGLIVTSSPTILRDGADARGAWYKTCSYCGHFNG